MANVKAPAGPVSTDTGRYSNKMVTLWTAVAFALVVGLGIVITTLVPSGLPPAD